MFDDLLERVKALTGLDGRDAAKVAMEFDDDATPLPQAIVNKAIELGFDVERKHGQTHTPTTGPVAEITMDPAEVLAEVYAACPRCLPVQDGHDAVYMPRIGRAPEQKEMEQFEDLLAELPDDVRVLLAKIDLFEGQATFWLRDEANEVDRPIGPIDLKRYDSDDAMREAFMTLLGRLPRVLAADFN